MRQVCGYAGGRICGIGKEVCGVFRRDGKEQEGGEYAIVRVPIIGRDLLQDRLRCLRKVASVRDGCMRQSNVNEKSWGYEDRAA